jgi:hypothetical protein
MIRHPFPIHALPPRIRIPLMECQGIIKSAPELLASSALSVVSLACQDKIDVVRPGGLRGPITLFFVSIAESGERKSSGDRVMSHEVRAFEAKHHDSHQPLFERYKAELSSWEERRRRLITRLNDDALASDHANLTRRLEEHVHKKPEEPARPSLLIADTTREAIFLRLHKVWPSAGLLSDEAGAIFAARTLSDLGLFNKLWDGDPITRDRATSESFTIRGARLTLSLMTQEGVLKAFMKQAGRLAHSIGFFARALVCQPISTMGTRLSYGTEPEWQAMANFHKRVRELLEESARNPGRRPPPPVTLEMTSAAKDSWLMFYNYVETNVGVAGCYVDVKDSGSKMAENAARMAACFHLFEGKSGPIDLESLDQAKEICTWYLGEAKRFAAAQGGDPQEIADAKALEKFFFRLVTRFPFVQDYPKNQLLQVSPVRNAARLALALVVLAHENKIAVGHRGRTWTVVLNRTHFTPQTQPPAPPGAGGAGGGVFSLLANNPCF